MWTRKIIKTRAKEILKKSYWKAFLVSVIIAVVGGGSGGSGGSPLNFNWNFGGGKSPSMNVDLTEPSSTSAGIFPFIFIGIFIVALLVIIFVLALRVFLGYPLEVGGRRYFIKSAQHEVNLNHIGYAFEKGKYLNIIKAMLWRGFLNFLWYLLLIIPGIVKSYAYSLVPYLLADNPGIGYKRALTLSKKMTDGQKFKMWVLDLSFIGWYLLGTLACLIGVLFVFPYVNATKAELYLVLRQNALDHGLSSQEELLIEI